MAQPALVANVQVTSLMSQRRFIVQWTLNPELDIASYTIFRSENQSAGFSQVGSVGASSTQFVDTVPFTFGVNYFWKVGAVNSGEQQSDISASTPVTDADIGQFDGEPFKQVLVQKADLVYQEVPSGNKNGVNPNFSTAFPFRRNTLQIFLNGVLQTPGSDYTETANVGFTMIAIIPVSTDILTVSYVKIVS